MDLASHGPDGSETATAGRWPWVTAFDQGVGRVIEVIAALLVVAEVVILFAGVVFIERAHAKFAVQGWPQNL